MSIYIHTDHAADTLWYIMRIQKNPAYNAPINVKSQMWGI